MPQSHNHQPTDRIIAEHDLPANVFQLIDDITTNGAVLVLRRNRPSIRIVPEAEIDLEQETILAQEATDILNQPDTPWFESVESFMAELEDGDAK